jgi:hypothetical protein
MDEGRHLELAEGKEGKLPAGWEKTITMSIGGEGRMVQRRRA